MSPTRTSARKLKDTRPPRVYQLKVVLMETEPPIWRRIEVSGASTLLRLHHILQAVMGWTNSHLHTFTAGGVLYSEPDPESQVEVRDERRVRLDQVVAEAGEAFVYEYDFGDSWNHQVVVEAVRVGSEGPRKPLCLGGARACPPEDCGGVSGYYRNLEILDDPENEEYEETRTWMESMLGGPVDPERFDIAKVNRALERVR